jgi:hypothetical protein
MDGSFSMKSLQSFRALRLHSWSVCAIFRRLVYEVAKKDSRIYYDYRVDYARGQRRNIFMPEELTGVIEKDGAF